MLVCGLKLTHDGAVAVVDDEKLVCCIEMEKLDSRERFASIDDCQQIADTLATVGLKPDDIDAYVVDGWGGHNQDELAIQPRLALGSDHNTLTIVAGGNEIALPTAQYAEKSPRHNVFEEKKFTGLAIAGIDYGYSSYFHVVGHIMSAYCTSDFARAKEPSFVLIWDGGMFPHLYYMDSNHAGIESLGPVFSLIGNAYTIFSQHFGPFKIDGYFAMDSLSVAGKVMAYIALGKNRPELYKYFDEILQNQLKNPMGFANVLATEFKKKIAGLNISDEDALCTFHHYLEELLVEKLRKKIARYPGRQLNLCFAGGCALNIKWNSALRESGIFDAVYVPPFPNDSGSALGQACAKRFAATGRLALDWSVYSGPRIIANAPHGDWGSEPCTPEQLAAVLHLTGEPVIFLNGNAELGPRALGNRSILAAAVHPDMKLRLNQMKDREQYRPVAPICLEDDAVAIFDPGTPDPFMLFDHEIRDSWAERIPAVAHLDGTARLQTVGRDDNEMVYRVLAEYRKISGIPLLCNTSANEKGRGFFPDVASATQWPAATRVWCEGVLHTRLDPGSAR